MTLDLSRVKAIFFDIDGTLSDTDDLWEHRLVDSLAFLKIITGGKNLQLLARFLLMVAESPANLVYKILDHIHLDAQAARLFNWMAHRRKKTGQEHFWMVPYGLDLIEFCQQRYPLAVISARDKKSTMAFLNQFQITSAFKEIITAQTCVYTKPFPHPLLEAARRMDVPVENCLMVGDTTVDILAGKAAGAQTLGVLCGFGTERELRRVGADQILSHTYELMALIKKSSQSS